MKPYAEVARVYVNDSCAGLESWQVIAYTFAVTLLAVWLLDFLFQEESEYGRLTHLQFVNNAHKDTRFSTLYPFMVYIIFIYAVVLTFYRPMPGATEFSDWATTDSSWVSFMDTKFGLVCSLLLCGLRLPVVGKYSRSLVWFHISFIWTL